MKIAWRLCCCSWAWVQGSLEFVKSTLSQFKFESIQFLKRKCVFKSKVKNNLLIYRFSRLCFLLVFERLLNWFGFG